MSSARSNNAAKSRRAGGADFAPPQQQQQQQNGRPGQQMQQQPHQNPKLTITDAIGLITMRLTRVEGIVNEIQSELPEDRMNGDSLQQHNSGNVSDVVINNIMSRLDGLEKGMKVFALKPTTNTNPTTTAPIVQQMNPVLLAIPSQVTLINEKIGMLQTEMDELKNHLLRLQSFTMETNQKLVDIVLHEENGEREEDMNYTVIDEDVINKMNERLLTSTNNTIDVNTIHVNIETNTDAIATTIEQ